MTFITDAWSICVYDIDFLKVEIQLSIQQIILWHPPLLAQPRPAKDAIHRDNLGEKDQADYGGAVSTWRTGKQLMMAKILIFIHYKFRESSSQLQWV